MAHSTKNEKKRPISAASPPVEWAAVPIKAVLPAEEIYIDGFQGMMLRDGLVKLNLYSEQYVDNSPNPDRYLRAYLCMSLPTLLSMHHALGEVIEDMKKRKII